MNVYICIYTYTYIYIYIHTCIIGNSSSLLTVVGGEQMRETCRGGQTDQREYIYIYTHTHTYIHIHIHTYIHIHLSLSIYIYMSVIVGLLSQSRS